MHLSRKVEVVTGAGRGIGRAIARRFAAEGAAVVVTARTSKEIDKAAAEIKKAGGKAITVTADVSREKDCQTIVRTALKTFGEIHILVNNAGVYGPVLPVESVLLNEWEKVIGVNLRAPFLLARLVLPGMYERGSGVILNLTSIAGKHPFGLNCAYAASKAGLAGFTRTLAAEGARKGVRVNALSPGPVPETKMSEELGRELASYLHADREELFKGMLQGILQGRPQRADEIAAAALFLVSDESSAITGQTLNVDGGMAFY